MSRILEGVFVLGCSLVGLGIGAPQGSAIQDTVQCSVQLIALAHDNVASNAARLCADVAKQITSSAACSRMAVRLLSL